MLAHEAAPSFPDEADTPRSVYSNEPSRFSSGAQSNPHQSSGLTATPGPIGLVRWAFYISVFAIPFARLYLPGTGERIGVTRLVQFVILIATLSQPRVCLRFVPAALLWLGAYCGMRIIWGLWLSPELAGSWWPSTLQWLQFSLPWLWVMFNVLQFPKIGRGGLWALIWGCALCASLHVAGIGTVEVGQWDEGRSSVFNQNANVIGMTYGLSLVALMAIGMFRDMQTTRRLLIIPLAGVIGVALAKTGSRTGLMVLAIGMVVLLLETQAFVPRARRVLVLLMVGTVLVGVGVQMPTILNRFKTLESAGQRQEEPRARMLPVLWEMFLRHPMSGSGPDQYQFELTRRAMPYLVREQRTISAHNLFLLVLVETGVIGFFPFFFGLKSVLTAAWRARSGASGVLPLALVLPVVIAAGTSSNPSSSEIFWLAIAYGLAGGNYPSKPDPHPAAFPWDGGRANFRLSQS